MPACEPQKPGAFQGFPLPTLMLEPDEAPGSARTAPAGGRFVSLYFYAGICAASGGHWLDLPQGLRGSFRDS